MNLGQPTSAERRERFLFVRPPRPMWPFNGPETSFWPPLAFLSLAAALREALPDLEVGILDAPIRQWGWRSLESELVRLQPTYVGIGEEAVSCVEGLRVARLAKASGARVIAGGCFFGQVAPQVLATDLIDLVVHGEGEVTLVELIQALRDGGHQLERVAGLSFRRDNTVVFTGHRPLLAELDRLPLPAYDLLPIERYGRRSANHPHFAALELSRGCLDHCDFCVLWRQMGHYLESGPTPRLRTKSPERLLEEIRCLQDRFGRRYLGWVDPCFNAHPAVPARLAERLLQENRRIGQSAWMRADGILRDDASGALEVCARAGLNEVYVGVERADDSSLQSLGKRETVNDSRRAFARLARRYPQIFTVASMIYGLPGDTPATVRQLYRLSLDLDVDKTFFIPLTPMPGTPFWEARLWDDSGESFRRFNFLPGATGHGSLHSLDRALVTTILLHWTPARLRGYWRGFTSTDARKRRLTWRLFSRSTTFALNRALALLRGETSPGGMVFPRWYED